MKIEPRSAWGARPPKSVKKIGRTSMIYLHHSVTGTGPTAQVLRQIQAYHMDSRGWQDFAYSFAVDVNGRAWTGRGPFVAGGHTAGYNSTSHAVVAIGNFEITAPSAALIEGLAQIAAHGYRQGWWSCKGYTGGHRMVAQTACPGDRLNAQIPAINRRVNQLLAGGSTPPKPSPSPAPSPSKPGELSMSDINAIMKELREIKGQMARKAFAVRDPRDQKVWLVAQDGKRYHLPNPKGETVALLTYIGVLDANKVHSISAKHIDLIPKA